jgi:DNA ligase-1
MSQTLFIRLAELGEHLEQTTKRREKTTMLAAFLQDLSTEEIPAGVRLTVGQVFPEWDARTLNLSWKAVMSALDDLIDASPNLREQISAQAVDGGEFVRILLEQSRRQSPKTPPLMILDVFRTFQEIAEIVGRGARARKRVLFQTLMEHSTPVEAKYLTKVVSREMRHGVSEGIMVEGIAEAADVKSRQVRRANQLWGDLGEVALIALTEGASGLQKATIRLFRPVKPMLAQTAGSLTEAFERFEGQMALEYKLDGARVQIHRQGEEVRIYSRNLSDVTASLPDVVTEIATCRGPSDLIFEGEVIAVDPEGRPLPFQHLMRRFRRKHGIAALIKEIPAQLYLFDALYLAGRPLVDAPHHERWSALEEAAGELALVRRLVPKTVAEGEAFAEAAHRAGHEGVMAKKLSSAYTPGLRGRSWLKLKHVMSLDLVIVAADWGYGRRHGWLSNYHLAALDSESGEYLVIGKTFKGLTDAEFQAMTGQLLLLERSRYRSTVFVQPRVVVEVLFNEIQQSSQYRSGFALRFARIARLRDDKPPSQADTVQTIRQLFAEQFQYKGQPPAGG